MPKRRISQEGLKTIACVTMLLDHIGGTVVLACIQQGTGADRAALVEVYEILRTVGRLAFPIYAFLLVEGHSHTRNPARYALRLLIAAALSEIPFDLAIFGRITWENQSVMLTLLIGFLMLKTTEKCPELWVKIFAILPFAIAAELLGTDYGARGILVIALFAFTGALRHKRIIQFFGLWFIFSPDHLMMLNWLRGSFVTIQEFASLAVLPIALYGGHKTSKSRLLQWGFYLFYPAHLLLLYFLMK